MTAKTYTRRYGRSTRGSENRVGRLDDLTGIPQIPTACHARMTREGEHCLSDLDLALCRDAIEAACYVIQRRLLAQVDSEAVFQWGDED